MLTELNFLKTFWRLKVLPLLTFSLKSMNAPQIFNINIYTSNTITASYHQISEEFCKIYYSLFDSSSARLSLLYKPNALITLGDTEITSFDNLCGFVRSNGIFSFEHNCETMNSQPIGETGILITVTGKVRINQGSVSRFSETFILEKLEGSWFISQNVIKFI